MKNVGVKVITLFVLSLGGLGFLFFSQGDKPYQYQGVKHEGMAVVAPPMVIGDTAFGQIAATGANWVSLMPYGFLRDKEATFHYAQLSDTSTHHKWWGETPAGLIECIKMAHSNDLKVMLKPHMWIGWGVFTGDFELSTEADWLEFERTYGAYLLQNARIAERESVELFCIGTEMAKMVEKRPQFWFQLISDIRKVYSGELTYAENWDAIARVPFWKELDYIGIDAYFPLAKGEDPSLSKIKKGWQPWKKELKQMAASFQKPILFTEIGYRSCDFSVEKPWETNYDLPDNENLQVKAFQAFFDEVWQEPWLAGAHLWKWFPFGRKNGRNRDKFRFQDKSAQKVVEEFYD